MRIPRNCVEQKSSFFEIILPGHSTEHVRIPTRFVRNHIVNKRSKWATLKLKRSSGHSWKVRVKKAGEDVYLKDGWIEFYRNAGLGDKEFLVFIYTGKMHFSMEVFDKNGCERMDFPDINTHQNRVSSSSPKRPRGRPRKSTTGNSADKLKEVKGEQVNYINNSEKSTSKGTEMPHGGQAEPTSASSKRPRGRPRKYPVTCKDSAAGKHNPDSESIVPKGVKKEEENYQESKCKQQYFTSKINRLSQVYLCKSFYVDNLSSQNYDFVFLKTSEGTNWYKVTLSKVVRNGVAFMTKGWNAFAVANEIKVGSLCQFQFLKENKIVVHILNN